MRHHPCVICGEDASGHHGEKTGSRYMEMYVCKPCAEKGHTFDRDGNKVIKPPVALAEQVHNILLDMNESSAERYTATHLLRQLCLVLANHHHGEVLNEVMEICNKQHSIEDDPALLD